MQAEGEFALVRQSLEAAIDLPGQPVKRGTMAHEHVMYMMLADSAAQEHDLPALQRYAPLLEELALRDEHRPFLAVAHRAKGVAYRLAGDHANAEMRLKAASALFEELDAHWQIGRTLVELGELDLDRSDGSSARRHFSQAVEAFEVVKAAPHMELTRERLQAISN